MGSASAYGVAGAHRHTPEFAQNLSAAAGVKVSVSFTPVLAPMPRGILTTASAPLAGEVDEAAVREVYQKAYDAEPFVQLLPPGVWPATGATLGSNNVALQLGVDADAGRLVVVTSIDNLTKGTAGGAVQSMNLALGFPEATGLSTVGVAP
jgi:N-acetyl-gamma-glutamyl-phosphate reductase